MSVIYKLFCKDTSILDCYVGSTKNIKRRMWCHKSSVIKGHVQHIYSFIRENGGFDNWDYIILETFEPTTKKDQLQKEQEYIRLLNPSLNSRTSFRVSKSDWYYENRDECLNKMKEYRKVHFEKLKPKNDKRHKEYILNNSTEVMCECGVTIKKYQLTKHKNRSNHHKDYVSSLSF